jgi:hypothetical protein
MKPFYYLNSNFILCFGKEININEKFCFLWTFSVVNQIINNSNNLKNKKQKIPIGCGRLICLAK